MISGNHDFQLFWKGCLHYSYYLLHSSTAWVAITSIQAFYSSIVGIEFIVVAPSFAVPSHIAFPCTGSHLGGSLEGDAAVHSAVVLFELAR